MEHFIGCDLHTRYQVVAWVEGETGEIGTRRLEHENGEAQNFYAHWPQGTVVGIEATFPALWFERLLSECGHELWVGDAARIRASEVRQQKTDLRRTYQRLKNRKASGVAKVAVARRLAVRLFWMLRTRHNYAQQVRMSGSPSSAVVPASAGSKV